MDFKEDDCDIYYIEIEKNLKKKENEENLVNYCINPDSQIKEEDRIMIINWFFWLQNNQQINDNCIYLSIKYLDTFLSIYNENYYNLDILKVTCFFIAQKLETTYVFCITDLIKLISNKCNKDDIIDHENFLLKKFNYFIFMVTINDFLHFFLKNIKKINFEEITEEYFYLCFFLSDISVYNCNFISTKPSLLSSTIIYIVNIITKKENLWNKSFQKITSYSVEDLKTTTQIFFQFLEFFDDQYFILLNTKYSEKLKNFTNVISYINNLKIK